MNRPAPEPADQRSRGQSLAEGATGIALLHIERAYAGAGTWQSAHAFAEYGISGPFALLTQALRRDVTVDGHRRNE